MNPLERGADNVCLWSQRATDPGPVFQNLMLKVHFRGDSQPGGAWNCQRSRGLEQVVPVVWRTQKLYSSTNCPIH